MKKNILSILAFLSCGLPALAYAEEPAKETTSKTAADVAGQALNILGDGVAKMSELVQKTAPEVWRIMLRQQYADATIDMTLSLLFFLLAIGIFYTTRNFLKKDDSKCYHDDWKVVLKVVIFISMFITAIVFVCNIGFGIGKLINPEYYAIKNMLELANPTSK